MQWSRIGLPVKETLRDSGLIPRPGRSPGGGNASPFKYFYLENSMDRGARWASAHGVTEADRTVEHTCPVSVKLFQSCLTLGDPVDCSPPGSSVRGILQARMLEAVSMPSSLPYPEMELHLLCLLHWQLDSLPLAWPLELLCIFCGFLLCFDHETNMKHLIGILLWWFQLCCITEYPLFSTPFHHILCLWCQNLPLLGCVSINKFW